MNPKDKPWTYQEEQQLIDLRYEGVPLIEVAQILDRTVDSCRKKHWKLLHEAYTPEWYRKVAENEK